MSEVFQIQLPDGRVVGIQANSPEEAATGARNIVAREKGEAQGKEGGFLSHVDNLVRQAANGITFGYADELASALDALTGRQKSYDEALAANRGQDDAYAKANPLKAGAANIAGNVASTVAALPAAATAMGPSFLGNVAKSAAVGAGLGGVQGFGEGEGGFEDRAGHAVMGAAAGGVGGGVVPFVGAAGARIAQSAPGQWVGRNVVAPALVNTGEALGGKVPLRSLSAAAPDSGPVPEGFMQRAGQSLVDAGMAARSTAQTGAVDRVATALQRGKMSPEDIAQELDRLGPDAVLADVNQALFREARSARTLPGETADLAKTVLEGREGMRPQRIISAFEGDRPTLSAYETLQAYEEQASRNARHFYQEEMAPSKLEQTPEFRRLLDNETVNEVWQKVKTSVEKAHAISRQPWPTPIEMMHKVKREIQDLGFDSMAGRPSSTAYEWREASKKFVNELRDVNPTMKAADAQYAHDMSLPERFDVGRNFLASERTEAGMNASAPALDDLMAGQTAQQAEALRAGMNTNVKADLTGRGAVAKSLALAKDIQSGPAIRERISRISPEDAQNILAEARRQVRFNETKQGMLGGSQTTDKLAEALDSVGNAGINIRTSGVTGVVREKIADLLGGLLSPSEGVRNEVGRMLLNTNSEEKRRILDLAAALLEQRAQGATARTATGAALGSEVVR